MTTITKILANTDLAEYLASEGCIDATDGDVWAEMVVTADTFVECKDGVSSYKMEECEQFGDVKVSVLRKFQHKKGNQRGDMFHVDFQDGTQNAVFIF